MQRPLLLLAMAAGALCASSVSTTTYSTCSTFLGTQSFANVVTLVGTTKTSVTTTLRITTTPTSTSTPPPVTNTVTVTSTSTNIVATQSTDTYTSVSTTTSTSTTSTTITLTSTSSTTSTSTSASTTTIATAAGFTPIEAEGYYVQRLRRAATAKSTSTSSSKTSSKTSSSTAAATATVQALLAPAVGSPKPSQFPWLVECAVTVEYITISSTTVPYSSTFTSTLTPVTATSTSTYVASTVSTTTLADATFDLLLTATASTTTTLTSTTSTTTTLTQTAVVPAATFYAQCGSNNLATSGHGLPIHQLAYSSAFTLVHAALLDTSGYGCCALCAQTPDCAGFGQYPNGGACYMILTSGQCDGSQTWGDSFVYEATADGSGYVVGNGACGALAELQGPVSTT